MEISKEKMKQISKLMVLAAVLVLVVIYSEKVIAGIGFFFSILSPFIVGGIIAFILNLPMRAYENRLFKRWKGKSADKLKRPLCMVLSIVTVLLILTIVVGTVLPQMTVTIKEVGSKVPGFVENVIDELTMLSKNYPELKEYVNDLENMEINWDSMVDSIIGFLKNGATNVINSTVSMASGIISGVVNFVISFIFAIYILSQKEKLADQGKRIVTAYLSEKAAAQTLKVCSMLQKNFSSFVTGQCLEAVILGTMFVVAMSIFRMPYAFLVGVLIAFTALIPIVGAFIGCAVGAFLILIENPILALWFVVMFLVIQQIEGNLIYPKVVGNSVGLPAIWVLVAVSVGGSLLGVTGMLFFIPLMSTAYALLRESVDSRNADKKLLSKTGELAGQSTEQKADAAEESVIESDTEEKLSPVVEQTKTDNAQ